MDIRCHLPALFVFVSHLAIAGHFLEKTFRTLLTPKENDDRCPENLLMPGMLRDARADWAAYSDVVNKDI